jgi:outer membrane protein assembly factor BamB
MAGPVASSDVVVVVGWDRVLGLAPQSGRQLWSVPREKGPTGPAAVAGEVAVFVEGRGKKTALVAVGIADGQEMWRVETRSSVPGGLTVDGDIVYAGARDGTLRALQASSGETEWSFRADGTLEGPVASQAGVIVAVAQERSAGTATVHAVDAASGRESWSHAPEGVAAPASAAAIGGGVAVVGLGDGRVQALDLSDGTVRWEHLVRSGFSHAAIPVLADDVVVGDVFGHVYRLDAETGRERWLYRIPGDLLLGSPAVVGEWVVVGGSTGELSAIDAETGHRVWHREVGGGRVGAVAVPGDRVVVAIRGGGVVSLTADPDGVLVDEPSPTTLFVGRALLSYAAGAGPLFLVLVLAFGALKRRRRDESSGPAETTGGSDEQEA